MYIQSNLVFLRTKNKLTYRELSKQTGVSFSAIKKIETKVIANPKILTLLKLTNFFNLSIDNFVNTDLTKNVPVTGTLEAGGEDKDELSRHAR